MAQVIYAPLHSHIEPEVTTVEVTTQFKLPSFNIIGLASKEVNESRERISSALLYSGFKLPNSRLIVNLSPANVQKNGTGSDLAIAIAILLTTKQLNQGLLSRPEIRFCASGELSLSGEIKSVGMNIRALLSAWKSRCDYLIVTKEDAKEIHARFELLTKSCIYPGKIPEILPITHLKELEEIACSVPELALDDTLPAIQDPLVLNPDSLLALPPALERLLSLTMGGKHSLLLLGARGSGKSHFLEWASALRPKNAAFEQIYQLCVEELRFQQSKKILSLRSPVRRIGQHVRPATLLGSITQRGVTPGEFSLAHGGILIADELPEWPRDSRECLREPLERGTVTLSRYQHTVELPSRFQLIAAGNLCECGGWSDEIGTTDLLGNGCLCDVASRLKYQARISPAIRSRIDVIYIVSRSENDQNPSNSAIEQFYRAEESISAVQEFCIRKWGKLPSQWSGRDVEDQLKNNLSLLDYPPLPHEDLRTRHKRFRLSFTLAALDKEEVPRLRHFQEAQSLLGRAYEFRSVEVHRGRLAPVPLNHS